MKIDPAVAELFENIVRMMIDGDSDTVELKFKIRGEDFVFNVTLVIPEEIEK